MTEPPLEGALLRANDQLPTCSAAMLAAMSVADLIEWLRAHDDCVPRNVIEECASRGEAMRERLRAMIDLDKMWDEMGPPEDSWMLTHAIHILGLQDSAAAGADLIEAVLRMHVFENDLFIVEFEPIWSALFRNKPAATFAKLQQLVSDRAIDTEVRGVYLGLLTDRAVQSSPECLEQHLDGLIDIATSNDRGIRFLAAVLLLRFPRDRHRGVLAKLAARGLVSKDDVDTAYEEPEDRWDWSEFADPWKFYDADEFAKRVKERAEPDPDFADLFDDTLPEDGDPSDIVLPDDDTWPLLPPQTYVRTTPKVGRNDPCPCGSGKKYKKCCLT